MFIMRSLSVLPTLCLMAGSSAAVPSVPTFLRLAQEVPCKVCILGAAETSYTPKPTCWQSTTYTEQTFADGYCGPAPDCQTGACAFDVTITVISDGNPPCDTIAIFKNNAGTPVASCTTCSSLAWNSGERALTCSTVNAFTERYDVVITDTPFGTPFLEHRKDYTCNICN